MLGIDVRGGAIIVLLVLVAACGGSSPTSPTASNPNPAMSPSTPSSVTAFPPLSGPARTFIFERELSHPVTDSTMKSRLVLYDNGAFVLQYPSTGEGGYRGGYSEANDAIVFEWEGWSTAGRWGAAGILTGDSLTLKFNLIMQLTDFEDAVYVRMR